jgi:amino acid transporter
MSVICILAGGVTSFSVGLCSVGGASIGLGWPLELMFALIVALTMAQVASAFPTAGGTYHWAYVLGGRGWGWVTACFSLAGLITVLAAVDLGLCRFVIGAGSGIGDYHPDDFHPWVQKGAVLLMCALQAFINHRGIRFTSRLNDLNGYLIMVLAAVLTIGLLAYGLPRAGFQPERLVTFTNYSGEAGADVFPPTENIALLFLMGMLLPAYTLSGFDASAQTSEETVDPERAVPRGIIRAVLISGIAGWIFLVAVVLASSDLDAAAKTGEHSFVAIIRDAMPEWTHVPLFIGLTIAQFLCGLAIVTSASRMAFAFARDGGLPFSRPLARISPSHQTPTVAIWTVSAAAALFAIAIPYTTIASVCAIFLYLSYVLPTALGMVAYRRSWTRMGPWHLGRWYQPLAALCVVGCAALFFVGMLPPNEIALWVVPGSFVALAVLWFGYMRWHFPGPPPRVLAALRLVDEEKP